VKGRLRRDRPVVPPAVARADLEIAVINVH
jgi:hypothetical protein